jgi:two-component system chemotaxis response regulator CheB
VLVQDPSEAAFPGMPEATLEAVPSARVAPVGGVAREVVRLLGEASEGVRRDEDPAGDDLKQAQQKNVERQETDGPTAYSCPDCGGALMDLGIEPIRLGCRTGHVFTLDALAGTQVELVEGALSVALRAVREHEAVVRRLARRASSVGNSLSAARFADEAGALRRNGDVLEALIAGRLERSVPGDERADAAGHKRTADAGASRGG